MRISQTGTFRSGFTLLELIVVVFIISLVSALVFPLFSGLGEKDIMSDAKKMASLLRYLNDSAIYTKETHSLQFTMPEGSLSWEGPEGKKTDRVRSLSGIDLQSKGLIREGEVTLFFGPLGIQENISILLRDKDQLMTVALNSTSGRVKIIEGGL